MVASLSWSELGTAQPQLVEDVLSEKERRRLEQYEDEAVDEIIEEEEWDVQADDSEVEPEDGKSYKELTFKLKRRT